jgi:hypothetical protein
MSEWWFRLLDRLYPPDFREEMGNAVVEAYMDRAQHSLQNGKIHLVALWFRALFDSLRNGPAERARPAASWRRAGSWGRDVELVRRRLVRSPIFAATTIGTLTLGLGMFAVVYTVVQKVLVDPMPYKDPGDLYYVWRDYGPINDVKRGALGGTDIAELQKPNTVIEAASALRPMLGGIFSLRDGAEAMEIAVTHISANLFQLLASVRWGKRSLTVIGVVNQARLYDVHADGRPQVLVRAEDVGVRPLYFVMRTTREPHSLLPEVRAAVRGVDPRVPVGDARAMDDIVDASLSPQAIGGALISAFAVGALLLAAMGLFGVVSGSVTRRRHELAVRLALGADHLRVLRLVLKEGALLVAAGLLIGAPGIYMAKGLICGLLVGVPPNDPLTLLAAAVGLLAVAMAACYMPARRALGIDPAQLLRQE